MFRFWVVSDFHISRCVLIGWSWLVYRWFTIFTFLIEKIRMRIASQTKTPELALSKQTFDKNVVWETQLVVMTNNARFLLCFWVLNKRKTGSKSNISYYRIPFGTDPESLSQKKVDSSNQEYAASISSVVSQRKLWWLVEV